MMRIARGLARGLAYTFLAVAVLVLLVAGAARIWLPGIEDFKPEAERFLTEYLGQEITMASLSAEWDGLNLAFKAGGVRVAVDDYPGSGMRFGEIFVSFNPLSLLGGRRTFDHLELTGPTIEVARLPDGRFRVGDTIIGTPRGTVRRLLQGRNLQITDGTLVWRDALAPGEAMQIENVHIRIRPHGERRRFEFNAQAPAELMKGFSAEGSYDPLSLKAGAWDAAVDLSVQHLNLTRIPAVIQERLPWQSHGYIDTDFHVVWTGGVLTAATADLDVYDFIIPYAKDKKPLSARRFTSSVSWRRSENVWRLEFSEPEILLDETPVSVSRFELQRRDEHRTYLAQDANVRDLLGVVNRLDIELPWKELIDNLQPRGVFAEAALTLTGPYLDARDWRFEGEFRNVGWHAQARYPGVQGLDGRLIVDDHRGELNLASTALEVDAAESMRGPIGFNRVEGNVKWYRWGRDWIVDVSGGGVANDEMRLTDVNFYTRIAATGSESPFVLARWRVERADIAALRDYLPVKRMTRNQVDWLDRALAGGEITRGRFYLKGSLDEFPYEKGTGELQASARISNGVLDFNEKWPNLTGLEGVIEIDNSRFEARADHGIMMNSPIRDVRAWSDDFFRRDRLLSVQGELRAKADDVIQFLRRGPLNKNPPPAYSRMTAGGEGDLSLMVELPFARLKEARVQGEYVFEDAAVEVMDGVEFTAVSGTVRFTESTVQGADLAGTLFGGPVRADVSTVEAGRPMTFAVTGSGEADVSHLTPVAGPALVSRLQGRAQWTGRYVGGPGPNRLEVRSNLAGVDILLPDPFWKPTDSEALLDVQVELDREHRRIDLDLEDRLRGELRYALNDGRPALVRGVLNLGADRELPESGLSIAVKGEQIDVDRWIAEVNELKRRADMEDGADPERDRLFDHLRSLDVDVNRFRYLRRNLGPVELNAMSVGVNRWTARFTGPRLQGTGDIRLDQSPARYSFQMSRMYWPRLENVERATTYKPSSKPSEFAHLAISAGDFRYGDMRLGRLELQGEPEDRVWRIRELSLQQPEFTVDIKGGWSSDQFDSHHSRVEITAETDQLGDTLTHLGLAGQVAKGEAKLSADLSWPGEPGDFSLATLNGKLLFNAKKGRFLKLEPGTGRLLGLFNADTLTRRITLDFTDVFEEGLTFDRIDGEAEITRGRLSTDGIFIIGPAALLELSGTTSLGEETYDLDVTVAPQLGGNLSLAGAIANPVAGAMIFVVQKLFKKQMAKLINYKYRVTGDWDAPRVESVERPARDMTNQPGPN